ncbi:MAG: peptidylprolyl isomerase [Dehalococcoidia bacterium]|nr:peptidylprolyl isomerase [Dehalococcoidia bacterium]
MPAYDSLPIYHRPEKTYKATIETTAGTMVADLFPAEAPKAVNNFVFLSRENFYQDVIFHRVIKGFVIQGGDPTGTGRGGPGYQFEDEPVQRDYLRGTLAMANAGPNTNGSQFFVLHADNPLPPNYTIFGKLTSGEDVVDTIAEAPTGQNDRPVDPVSIKQVSIEAVLRLRWPGDRSRASGDAAGHATEGRATHEARRRGPPCAMLSAACAAWHVGTAPAAAATNPPCYRGQRRRRHAASRQQRQIYRRIRSAPTRSRERRQGGFSWPECSAGYLDVSNHRPRQTQIPRLRIMSVHMRPSQLAGTISGTWATRTKPRRSCARRVARPSRRTKRASSARRKRGACATRPDAGSVIRS